ncbi:MAG: acetylesterase [Clostridia bacterium]|nr:acetylesterase [Clostridia bacterium]
MALVEVNFISKALKRTVTFNAIIPTDKFYPDDPRKDPKDAIPYKTLYLLHGAYGNYTDYLSGTRIQRWAEAQNLAVIMPSGENYFYLDQEDTQEYYGKFVGEELVEFTRLMFPLSHKREDTFIAGLSMGGYGALVNGLRYHETFSHIGLFSPGLLMDDLINRTELIEGVGWPLSFWDRVFGTPDTLAGSDRDYCHTIETMLEQKIELPKLYLTIGRDDFLFDCNTKFRAFLDAHNVLYTYDEDEGAHEWDFWDRHLKSFLAWLPLEDPMEGFSSGNVR